ncbi:MAG: hypothetical protein Q7S56_04205 [Nanoarchaeota archaeon]|nr:hypothetical protein [Nanoarchaeota archaeon]
MVKRVSNNERHVRWNFEPSPDSMDWNDKRVRYHFVIVNDKYREGILGQLLSQLSSFKGIEEVRKIEGKVAGTSLMYLFASYDSSAARRFLKFEKIVGNKDFKQDTSLIERKKGNIEDYVANIYGR